MKNLKIIGILLLLTFMGPLKTSAKEPYLIAGTTASGIYTASLNDRIVYHYLSPAAVSVIPSSFFLISKTAPFNFKSQVSPNDLSEHFFVRPYTQKEFRIVRFLDNSLQLGLTKLIISI